MSVLWWIVTCIKAADVDINQPERQSTRRFFRMRRAGVSTGHGYCMLAQENFVTPGMGAAFLGTLSFHSKVEGTRASLDSIAFSEVMTSPV